VVLLLTSGFFYTPWSWLPRIVTQFTAGALACAAVRRLELSERARRVVGYVSLLVIVAMVGGLYLLDTYPLHGVLDGGGVVDVLFVPLVITLAIGVGSLPRLLSTRVLVYGGQISFCLYMVHELVHTGWTWAVVEFQLTPWHSDSPWKWNIFGLLAIAVAFSSLLYHFVEEPARRWMRRMVDIRPASANAEAGEPASATLHQIDGGLEGVSARAV
jgi:peptidoglycan/LPS O-acetylase OafA/YrhL